MNAFLKKISVIGREVSSLRVSVYSGNASFFLLLSLFPAAMALLGALKYLPATVSDLESFIMGLTPAPLHQLIHSFFGELNIGNATILSVSALGALWSITRGMLNVMNGLDVVYHTEEHRPLLRKWFISLFGAVLFLICILATLLLQVFGGSLYEAAKHHGLPIAGLILSLLHLRWPLTLGFLTLVFCLMYTVLPQRRQKFVKNIPGALLATCGWHIFSALYGFYVENFSNYANLYGGLTAAVSTLLWVYFCMNLLFYGGLFNYILNEIPHPFRRLWEYLCR